jgi:hypothetical protein
MLLAFIAFSMKVGTILDLCSHNYYENIIQ